MELIIPRTIFSYNKTQCIENQKYKNIHNINIYNTKLIILNTTSEKKSKQNLQLLDQFQAMRYINQSTCQIKIQQEQTHTLIKPNKIHHNLKMIFESYERQQETVGNGPSTTAHVLHRYHYTCKNKQKNVIGERDYERYWA